MSHSVCNNSGEDTISRELSVGTHSGTGAAAAAAAAATAAAAAARLTVPAEPNYLDPTPARINGRMPARFIHTQQNGVARLASIESSTGLISPQGTLGSPSPPPPPLVLPSSPPSPPPPPPPPPLPPQSQQPHLTTVVSSQGAFAQEHPSSLYANEEVFLSSLSIEEDEHNNNKSQGKPTKRPCTASTASTASTAPLSREEAGTLATSGSASFCPTVFLESNFNCRLPASGAATYMNVDIATDELSLLSPGELTPEPSSLKEEITDIAESTDHAYINISPGNGHGNPGGTISSAQDLSGLLLYHSAAPLRSTASSVLHSEAEEAARHCYANLEASEIEGLRKRISGASLSEKASLPPSTPTAPLLREVNYAVLDLDQRDAPFGSFSLDIGTTGTAAAVASPPDSPNKLQKGYATIDFNKTAALSHSVNPNLVNDNEGSRKTRHNSTITDLTAATASRHSSSVSD